MTFERLPDSEIDLYPRDACKHIRDCYDEISFLSRVREGQSDMIRKEQERWKSERDRADKLHAELDELRRSQASMVDNDDGTVTLRGLPVTVPAGLIPTDEKIAEVRSLSCMKTGLRAINDVGRVYSSNIGSRIPGSLRLVLAQPTFEIGKYYRNRKGNVRGPLTATRNEVYVHFDGERSYTRDGKWWAGDTDDRDLVPGAVEPPPTWVPPTSLKDGEYVWDDDRLANDKYAIVGSRHLLKDWTDPPKNGKWIVKDGVATWGGE